MHAIRNIERRKIDDGSGSGCCMSVARSTLKHNSQQDLISYFIMLPLWPPPKYTLCNELSTSCYRKEKSNFDWTIHPSLCSFKSSRNLDEPLGEILQNHFDSWYLIFTAAKLFSLSSSPAKKTSPPVCCFVFVVFSMWSFRFSSRGEEKALWLWIICRQEVGKVRDSIWNCMLCLLEVFSSFFFISSAHRNGKSGWGGKCTKRMKFRWIIQYFSISWKFLCCFSSSYRHTTIHKFTLRFVVIAVRFSNYHEEHLEWGIWFILKEQTIVLREKGERREKKQKRDGKILFQCSALSIEKVENPLFDDCWIHFGRGHESNEGKWKIVETFQFKALLLSAIQIHSCRSLSLCRCVYQRSGWGLGGEIYCVIYMISTRAIRSCCSSAWNILFIANESNLSKRRVSDFTR